MILMVLLTPPCCRTGVDEAVSNGRPNILLAIADDWGWPHAGAYGDPVVKTPTFDRVAREGSLLSRAFVSSPSCTPSRAALLTGQWHWRLGESANLWSTLRADIPVYPDLIEEAGYFVGFAGKGWGPGKFEVGGRNRNPAGVEFDSFSSFISQKPPEKPFCFWFGSLDPHRPYDTGFGRRSGIAVDRITLNAAFPDSPEVRNDIADYYYEVQRFDREVGEILQLLESRGELANTLIVVTSDNGMPFPRAKSNLYDTGTRVPLAIWWPGRITGGRVIENLVSLTDLAPTFLEAAGVAVPEVMTGKSLLSTLRGQLAVANESGWSYTLVGKERHVQAQEGSNGGGFPMRAIRTERYLYIVNLIPDRWPAGTPNWERAYFPGSWYGDVDNGPTKFYMTENRTRDEHHARLFSLAFEKRPPEELYDLDIDPEQLTNRASDPAYQGIKTNLAEQLEQLLLSSEDPRAVGGLVEFDEYPYYGGSPLHPEYEANQ